MARNYFSHLVDIGNTVNRKDKIGNPVINIHPEELSAQSRAVLIKSTDSKKASLQIEVPQSHGTEAPICYSFVTLKDLK